VKFHGVVGVATGDQIEKPANSGIFVDEIEERVATGEQIRDTRQIANPDKVNFDMTLSTTISVMADVFADVDFLAFRYCERAGVKWVIVNVEPARPRLLLTLGGVYNGPTPEPTDAP